MTLAGPLAVDQSHEDGHGHVVAAGVVHVRVRLSVIPCFSTLWLLKPPCNRSRAARPHRGRRPAGCPIGPGAPDPRSGSPRPRKRRATWSRLRPPAGRRSHRCGCQRGRPAAHLSSMSIVPPRQRCRNRARAVVHQGRIHLRPGRRLRFTGGCAAAPPMPGSLTLVLNFDWDPVLVADHHPGRAGRAFRAGALRPVAAIPALSPAEGRHRDAQGLCAAEPRPAARGAGRPARPLDLARRPGHRADGGRECRRGPQAGVAAGVRRATIEWDRHAGTAGNDAWISVSRASPAALELAHLHRRRSLLGSSGWAWRHAHANNDTFLIIAIIAGGADRGRVLSAMVATFWRIPPSARGARTPSWSRPPAAARPARSPNW